MLHIREHIPLRPKTTLRIGGHARWYAELKTKEDVEEAVSFAREKNVPLIVLGGGSNTIFADGTIEALVVRIVADKMEFEGVETPDLSGEALAKTERASRQVRVEAGKNLANLIAELARRNLDLSPLTGIPGTVGGAIFGNSGQGYGGIWIGAYVESVETFADGVWRTFAKNECGFAYRTSAFKHWCHAERSAELAEARSRSTIIWRAKLNVPSRPRGEINAEIERLLQRRIETQPHAKTAGSCFLSINKDTPAWKLIDSAGLRGHRIGGIKISEKHANFLINEGNATFEDAETLVTHIRSKVPTPLTVEMRFIERGGYCSFE